MDIKATIRNLLARAEGTDSEHEAQAALLKAQELMHKYRVEEGDLSEKKLEIVTRQVMLDVGYQKVPYWVWRVVSVVAENFRCFNWKRQKCGIGRRWYYQPMIMGDENDVEAAAQAIQFAINAAKQLYRRFRDSELDEARAGDRNAYYLGFVDGLRQRYLDQVQEKALIIVKPDQVIKRYNEIARGFTATSPAYIALSSNDSARSAGYRDGRYHTAGSLT